MASAGLAGPASASRHIAGHARCAEIFRAGSCGRGGRVLGVTAQAEDLVASQQHLVVHRTVHVVAHCASFPQGEVLKDLGLNFVAMALATFVVHPGDGRGLGLQDIVAMGIMAVDAAHLALADRMMRIEIHLGLHIRVALVTARRILAGVGDEFVISTASIDVFAAGTVAGFAANL